MKKFDEGPYIRTGVIDEDGYTQSPPHAATLAAGVVHRIPRGNS